MFSSDNGGVPYAGALNYPFRGSKVREISKVLELFSSTMFYFLVLSYCIIINNLIQSSQATVYEGGVRSPGFLHAPNLLGEGGSLDGLVHVSDFFPTIVSIVAHTTNSTLPKLDQRLDGVDLLPALLDRQENWVSKEKISGQKSQLIR